LKLRRCSRPRFSAILAVTVIGCARAQAETPLLVQFVNTLQGTNSTFELSRGNTFPATARPFGMHMWTPQTGRNGDGWKYQYARDTIRGFQQSHQCSPWSNDYAVFSLMPVVGRLVVNEDARAVRFRHEDEVARPHYYRVGLESGVVTEMTATERCAHLRFTFPPDADAYLVFDGYTERCGVQIQPDEGRILGHVKNGRNLPEHFRNHFVIEFDQLFVGHGTWQQESGAIDAGSLEALGRKIGAFVKFAPGSVVQVKVGSSYISREQAELNLTHELEGVGSFDEALAASEEAWNRHFSQVVVRGGSIADKSTFYTCQYRASLFPHRFFEYDAAGEPHYFSPYDGKVHAGYMFTDTGFWDTFRAQFPLNTILYPTMHGRYMQALLAAYEQCGWLPSWSFPGEAGSMIGNHAISLLTDAWAKGIRTFDPAQALEAYQHEASTSGPWGPANGRDGWEQYNRLAYVPYPEVREATAKTLEYAYDDFCGHQLATMTRNGAAADDFAERMFNYRHVYDASTGFMRGRDAEGRWMEPFDPVEWGGAYTEGCAWHWQWSVFHDVAGLIELMGGDEKFVEKLDAVFTQTNEYKVGTYGAPIHEMREMALAEMGQYAHGNQPMQHMPYLYCYAREPWKTQQHVRRILRKLYSADENGLPGDDDQGQTSAWFVMSALGFYSVCPGTDQYVLGSPLFKEATISLENGKQFVIHATGDSDENCYIQSARLNGRPWPHNFLRHQDIVTGGRLDLQMGPEPNRTRGIERDDRPFSISTVKE
jgi:predicted alpha-1,2-mannosidase